MPTSGVVVQLLNEISYTMWAMRLWHSTVVWRMWLGTMCLLQDRNVKLALAPLTPICMDVNTANLPPLLLIATCSISLIHTTPFLCHMLTMATAMLAICTFLQRVPIYPSQMLPNMHQI